MPSTWDQVEDIVGQAAENKEQSYESSYDNDVERASSKVDDGVNDFAQSVSPPSVFSPLSQRLSVRSY